MNSAHAPAVIRNPAVRPWAALAVTAALTVAGCGAQRAGKSGGAPAAAPSGTITLTFASADPLPVDTTFATLVNQDSGGHLRLRTVYYNARSTSVDQTIAADLAEREAGCRRRRLAGLGEPRGQRVPRLPGSVPDHQPRTARCRGHRAGCRRAARHAQARQDHRAGDRAGQHQVPVLDPAADHPGAVLRRQDPDQRLRHHPRGPHRAGGHTGDRHRRRPGSRAGACAMAR